MRDVPTFTLRFEHIPGVNDSEHPITIGFYTTEERPLLSERCWRPFDRGDAGRYEIRETKNAGKGMFSLDSHAAGGLVACDRPLVVFAIVDKGTKDGTVMERTLARMPAETRDVLLALHSCEPDAPSVESAIARTNRFEVGQVPEAFGPCCAVFNDLSRINHCCAPNATFHWDPESLTGYIRALQPIAPGEEVFITYVANYAPYHRRQETLPRLYAFMCTCATCALPSRERIADDDVRQECIRASEEAGNPPVVTAATAVVVTKAALRLARRMRGAGLYEPHAWAAVSRALVETACVLGDRARAVRWALVAAGAVRAETGADGGWDEVAAAPERTEAWLRDERVGDATQSAGRVVWNGPQFCPECGAM
ncbi:SET domain-containing protein [Auriscalpium vulgare]|uniref:SET domain-containing protein n=1 Tax=Auriscalpium vulgare TaxID=40419 RepID=A0ACB8RIW5_9AGAM|nr:SET domain-containing protein [Auriscalpium vulgare]